jgi:hypothetical protein
MSEYNDEQFDVCVQSTNDILNVLEHRTLDDDGLSWFEWHKRIQNGDALYNIVQKLAKNRHDPRYADLVKEIEDEIEGWL